VEKCYINHTSEDFGDFDSLSTKQHIFVADHFSGWFMFLNCFSTPLLKTGSQFHQDCLVIPGYIRN